MISDERFVWIRRQWNGTPAKYRRDDFQSPHWSQDSGGRGGRQPRCFIFGYVMCDGSLDGEIGHSGSHGPCPHRIKVCVVAKDNTTFTMTVLRQAAGTPPPAAATARTERPSTSTALTQYLARSTGPPQNGCPRIADTSCPRNYGTSDCTAHQESPVQAAAVSARNRQGTSTGDQG
jgi:hypothetical protein